MAQAITVAPQPLDNVMVEAIDFFHIAKFSWTTDDNVSRLEPTVIEQVRQASFTFVTQQDLNALPYAMTVNGAFGCGFLGAAWLW
jgi:hypothetical protein